jgi:hypothetical protein
MMYPKLPRRVDETAIRVNQAIGVGLLLVAWLLDSLTLVLFVALAMLAGTASPELALFQIIYRKVLLPRHLVKPRIVIDNPEPHLFAQGLGGALLALGLAALIAGYATAGWTLVWLVVALAALNLLLDFCAGCFLYYQLNRLGVPGFRHGPIHLGRCDSEH